MGKIYLTSQDEGGKKVVLDNVKFITRKDQRVIVKDEEIKETRRRLGHHHIG